jgi:hypothetical protein
MTGLHRWYLQGRDDADEDLDLEQFDAETLARRVLSGTPIRDLTVTAMTDLLAIDPHDGSEAEWAEEHQDDLEEDEVNPKDAYKEWRRGWIDEGAHQLEADIVEAMQELLDELDEGEDDEEEDDESDGGRATLRDYERTGVQDCDNVWDGEEIDRRALARKVKGKSSAERDAAIEAAIDDMWKEYGDDIREDWVKQNAADVKDNRLDVDKAFKAWQSGYRVCQRRWLERWIKDDERDLDDE